MRVILRPLRWARPAWTLPALNLLCAVGLCAISGFMLWDMRQDAERRATASARSLVQVLGRGINRSIATYDLSLRAIVDGMRLPTVMNADLETRILILFERAANAENFGHTCQTAWNVDPGSASKVDPLDGYGVTPLISPAERVGVAQPG
ncbi:MAG: hypothetical protein WAP03_14775 [Methylorubrum rhodinum]|uniref:hypothetical protein n=1 Tax=Methylorubrum rhodinum TaxID=29428 RepID=UPI003BB15911